MLHLPGQVERAIGPVGPRTSPRINAPASKTVWLDLMREFIGAGRSCAVCNAVMLVERGRRPVTLVRPVARASALAALRRAWPIVELHPHRRHGQLLAAVARCCSVFEMRLSRQPTDVLKLLDDARYERSPSIAATVTAPPTASSREGRAGGRGSRRAGFTGAPGSAGASPSQTCIMCVAHGRRRLRSRGNRHASFTFASPSICLVRRSRPMPIPPCAGMPCLNAAR